MRTLNITAAALGTLALSCVAPQVLAEQSEAGPYVGIGWGHFDLKIDNLNDVGTAVNSIAHSGDDSWKIFAGYRLSPYFSLEANYIDFGKPTDTFTGTGYDGNYQLHLSGFAPYAVGTLPLGIAEIFAKAGYLYYNDNLKVYVNAPGQEVIQSKHTRGDFVYGGGLGVTLIDHLNISAEYDVLRVEDADNSNAFWLTTAWRF